MNSYTMLRRYIHIESLAFLLLFAGSLYAVYYPLAIHIQQTPPDSVYTYAEGYLPDYYQYLGWVKDGMTGHVLVSSRYTEVEYPRSLVHTLFPLTGMIGRVFGLPSYSSYTILRIISNIIFLFALAIVVRKIFPKPLERALSYVLLLAITGVWSLNPGGNLTEAVYWSGNFNAMGKFFLPPHHLLSLSFLLLGIMRLLSNSPSKRNTIVAAVCVLIGGFLNPSLLTFFTLFLATAILATFLSSRLPDLLSLNRFMFTKVSGDFLFSVLLILGISGLILAYNTYLFQTTLPWSRMYTLMRGFNPPVTFSAYLKALGPSLIPAALGLLHPKIRGSLLGLFLAAWAFLPLLVFHFLGKPLPMNASRLFQSYQYIPLGILAAAGVAQLSTFLGRFKIPRFATSGLIAFVFLLYSLTPFQKGMQQVIGPIKPWYFNYYVPASLLRTFGMLDSKTPRDSVVLASEAVSTMIPAFTHNRVLMGRDDVAPDYYEKREKAFAMLDGRFTENDAREFLRQYKVKYILFGIDAQQFRNTSNPSLPFLNEIYTDGSISLIEVTL